MKLYGIPVKFDRYTIIQPNAQRWYEAMVGDINLTPKYDGNYEIPSPITAAVAFGINQRNLRLRAINK